jgi:Flp pilus assembly protein TadB
VRRAALAGRSFGEVATSLLALPITGDEARLAVWVADQSGGAVAEVFLRLADRAAAAADLDRQRRILTAQTRLSAAIVGGLPLVWLGFGGVGRLQALVDSGGAAIAAVGLGMETMGAVLVWRLAST